MAEIELEPHDPVWRTRFERERDRVREASPAGPLGVLHVGSTAVADLAAKPVLDVLAVYDDYEGARAAATGLVATGCDLRRDEPDWVRLNRTGDEYPAVLHLRPRDAEAWRDQVVFRELLRESPEARAEYERVKRVAAATHPNDADAYTDAKEETVLDLVERAYDEGYDDRLPAFA
ncbi:GrpB family protein [Halorussus sp. AFM4]|uniref:GrpB family protein n=1 Tax=Halorussus sp. AFM4 TaxID=3421651 RepID=UPI003EB90960